MSTCLSTAFYDSLFGKYSDNSAMNQLEVETLTNVRKKLNNPKELSKQIPPLPNILLELIESLKDNNATFVDFVEIIEKDPVLALTVVKVSNTAKYSRGDEDVLSVKKAVGLLGTSGVAQISTTILMQSIMPSKPIYFKMFGKQIWEHSLQCASIAQAIAAHYEKDEFDAHFIGLIHDVGKIIIFESLCNAFGSVFTGDTPGTTPLKS